jgi:maleylpyruvate isomerase
VVVVGGSVVVVGSVVVGGVGLVVGVGARTSGVAADRCAGAPDPPPEENATAAAVPPPTSAAASVIITITVIDRRSPDALRMLEAIVAPPRFLLDLSSIDLDHEQSTNELLGIREAVRPLICWRAATVHARLEEMSRSLDADPATAIAMCQDSHARLMVTVGRIGDQELREPSRLPGWTIAHVLTHIARNADGHVHRLEGALVGKDLARYPGGPAQRQADIEEGAGRSADAILADLSVTQRALEQTWQRCVDAGWPHADLRGDDEWRTTASPVRRLREMEVHHVDLGLGYTPSDWPDDYVAWELPMLAATVPGRLSRPADQRALVAWLSGRSSSIPAEIELAPW